jgi:hypothetical protein
MPFLGQRHWYKYTSDNLKDYKIQMLDYLATAAGLELDDSLPEYPRRWKPRYVWVQAIENTETRNPARKKLIIQMADIQRFRGGATVEVAGVKMRVMGFYGEYRYCGRNF